MIICIDPGHGGSDSGAVGFGIRECDIALIIANKLKSLMENVGYESVLTRTQTLMYSDRTHRLRMNYKQDVTSQITQWLTLWFQSIVMPVQAMHRGQETFYYVDSPKGEQLAQCVQNQIIGLGELVDRGIKEIMVCI